MAGKFASRGDFSIPSELINEHEWICDSLIDDMGASCDLVYEPIASECNNCIFDPATQKSSGIYKVGGPISFDNFTVCPICGGDGRSVLEQKENIKLRVYLNQRDWIQTNIKAMVGNDVFQIIGYMNDLPKIERAKEIIVHSDLVGIKYWRCEPSSEATPWGFRGNRYFVMFLKRVGGG